MTTKRASSELWTAATAAAADRHTMQRLGIPSPLLMERAALCVAHEVAAMRAGTGLPVVALCGPGNNGGDGLALCRQLFGWEIPARAVLVGQRPNATVGQQRALCEGFGVTVGPDWPVDGPAVVVDALLGTGSAGAPRGAVAEALARQRGLSGPRVSVDIPTGVDADTGAVHRGAFVADRTVSFVRAKLGLMVTPGRGHAGTVVVADIGLLGEPDRDRNQTLVDPGLLARVLSRLASGQHKGQRGHLGIVGGSAGTVGAAVLAGAGALRAGTGLVTVASDDPQVQAQLVAHRPELMVTARTAAEGRDAGSDTVVAAAGALCVGPGLTAATDRRGIAALWRHDRRPAVYDASALSEIPLDGAVGGPRVITPHPGEAAQLLQRAQVPTGDGQPWTSARVQAHRVAAVRALAVATGAVAVLKGEGTLIATPASDGPPHVHVVLSGSSALATAGSGDVMAGIAGGLLARGVGAPLAACAATYIHGVAGELASQSVPGAAALDIAELVGAATAHVLSGEGRHHPRWPRLRRG